MFRALRIELAHPNPTLVHEFRNFGEEVYAALRDVYGVSLKEIDASTSEFHVRRIHRRELRRVEARVRRLAERYANLHPVLVQEVMDDGDA